MGSILRTALFLGTTAVISTTLNSSPLSPAVAKVSSGASEFKEVYSVK